MIALGLTLGLALAPMEGETSPEDLAAAAADAFAACDAPAQAAILAEIDARLVASTDPGLKKLLALRDRAKKELRVESWPGPQFFTHSEFAPTQVPRAFVADDSDLGQQQLREIHPENSDAQFCRRIRYDYGRNTGVDRGHDPPPDGRMLDLLAGYVPGNDVLTAWIEAKLDWDDTLDKRADYFDHAYCDREGHAFAAITIFDAYASQMTIEMPDVDAIAYARRILRDNSFTSPIPADNKRTKLYRAISGGFLELFKHRTMVEEFAWLYVNPDSILRKDHEGMRNRALLAISHDGEDIGKLGKRLRAAKDRDGFVKQIDKLVEKDDKPWQAVEALKAARLATRTAVCDAAWAVLDAHGLSTPPQSGGG